MMRPASNNSIRMLSLTAVGRRDFSVSINLCQSTNFFYRPTCSHAPDTTTVPPVSRKNRRQCGDVSLGLKANKEISRVQKRIAPSSHPVQKGAMQGHYQNL